MLARTAAGLAAGAGVVMAASAVAPRAAEAATTGTGITDWLNATASPYNADPTGGNDSTQAINQALSDSASLPKPVPVYLPAGTYVTSAALVMGNQAVLFGDGIDLTVIAPTPAPANSQFNAIQSKIPTPSQIQQQTLNAYVVTGAAVRDLTIDCSRMTAGAPAGGAGNGIFWFGAVLCVTERVRVTGCPNWGIVFDATPNNDAYDSIVSQCRIEGCAGGINLSYNTAARIMDNYLSGPTGNTTAASQPAFSNVSDQAYSLADYSANALIRGNVFGQGSTAVTNPAITVTNTGTSRIIGNFFINCSGAAIATQTGGHNQIITGNEFSSCCFGGSYSGPCLSIGADGTVITGNVMDVSNGAVSNMTYAIEQANNAGSCTVTGNMLLAGSHGVISEGPGWYIGGNIEGGTSGASGGTGHDFPGPVSALTGGSGGASSTAEFEVGSFTIPAGQPLATTMYRLITHGGFTSATASQTVEFRVRLNTLTGAVVFDSGLLTPKAVTGSDWIIDATIAFRGTGSTDLDCWGTFLEKFTTGLPVSHGSIESYVAANTTAALNLIVTAEFSVSNASNFVNTIQGSLVPVNR
jgi:Pectate lyase superfamily protein